ncbi:MAG: methionine--tRNA ligase [Tepidisphaerales bacterium]
MAERFYITTPIYYPNGEPHLGHLYTTLCADTVARYMRLTGRDVFFLTGTDEHGVKMVKSAAEVGTTPDQLADRNARVFQETFRRWHMSNDDFIRTTQDRHKTAVQEIVRRLLASGDIYLGSYEGWYDEGQEEFVTESNAKAQDYKSAISGRPLTRYSEPTYFFRLGRYVPRIIDHIERNPAFVRPESRRNEVLSKLRMGVDDLSISRPSLKWGIPMPNDPGHVLYVWIDALSNYVTALGMPPGDGRGYWPASVHLIGKEILWFHAVYWPAMLMALGWPLPKQLFAHGWWTAEGKKMSKSMGNFIDIDRLDRYAATYTQDAVRYYLLRAAPFGSDLDFAEADFIKAFNELADLPGNGLNRVIRMLGSYEGGRVPELTDARLEPQDRQLLAQADALAGELARAYGELELQAAALQPIELARSVNGYIEATAPFKMKDPSLRTRRATVLAVAARALAVVYVGLLPVLPEKAVAALAQLGIPAGDAPHLDKLLQRAASLAGTMLSAPTPLFPKPQTTG